MTLRLAAAAILALTALGVAPDPAAAHAQLVSSSPGAGELLSEPPTEIRLLFSEPIEPGFSDLDLVDGEGDILAEGIGEPAPDDPNSLVAPFSATADGVYTVTWRVLSAADGHVTSGFVVFGVGDVALGPSVGGPAEELGTLHSGHDPLTIGIDVLGRTLSFGGLMVAFGLAVVARAVLAPVLPDRLSAVAAAQAVGLVAAAAGAALGVVVGASDLPGGPDPAAYVNESRTGQLLGLRVLTALAGIGAAFGMVTIGRLGWASVVAGAAALAGIVLVALGGHASGYGGAAPVVADVVHLAAAGVWIAGVATIAMLLLRRGRAPAPMVQVIPRFSALALVAIALVAATGTYASWLATRDFTTIGTPFTANLALKLAAVAAALGLGGLNFLDGGRGTPALGGLRRRVLAEAALAALIVVLAANLTSGSPPAGARAIEIEPAVSGDASAAGIRLELQPGRPGPNRASAELDAPHEGTAELILQRLDSEIGSTRIELHPVTAGGTHGAHGEGSEAPPPVATQFLADGVGLAADSRWDATLVLADASGAETDRRRFTFAVGDRGIVEGSAEPLLDPLWLVPVGLLGLGLLALSYWIGGGSLPRTEPRTSRLALVTGGATSLALGLVMLIGSAGL